MVSNWAIWPSELNQQGPPFGFSGIVKFFREKTQNVPFSNFDVLQQWKNPLLAPIRSIFWVFQVR